MGCEIVAWGGCRAVCIVCGVCGLSQELPSLLCLALCSTMQIGCVVWVQVTLLLCHVKNKYFHTHPVRISWNQRSGIFEGIVTWTVMLYFSKKFASFCMLNGHPVILGVSLIFVFVKGGVYLSSIVNSGQDVKFSCLGELMSVLKISTIFLIWFWTESENEMKVCGRLACEGPGKGSILKHITGMHMKDWGQNPLLYLLCVCKWRLYLNVLQ